MITFNNFSSENIRDILDLCTMHLNVDATVTENTGDKYRIQSGEHDIYVDDLEGVVSELFAMSKQKIN